MKPYKPSDLDPLIPLFAPPEVTASEWEAIRGACSVLADSEAAPVVLPTPASCGDSDSLQRLCWHLQRCARAASLPLHFLVRKASVETTRDRSGRIVAEEHVPAAIVAGVRKV